MQVRILNEHMYACMYITTYVCIITVFPRLIPQGYNYFHAKNQGCVCVCCMCIIYIRMYLLYVRIFVHVSIYNCIYVRMYLYVSLFVCMYCVYLAKYRGVTLCTVFQKINVMFNQI